MLDFGKSKLREKLLGLYFFNIDASFYVRELAGRLSVDPTNLSRELRQLKAQGLFISESRGKLKFYKLNKSFPTFKELKIIIKKTVGVVGVLREALEKLPGLELALLFGSFAHGDEDQLSDIDIFIVSDLKQKIFYELVSNHEKKLGREINLTIYSKNEYKKKYRAKDPFLMDILKNKHEIIAGKL